MRHASLRCGCGLAAALVLLTCPTVALAQQTRPRQPPVPARPPRGVEFGISGLVGAPIVFSRTSADLTTPDGGKLTLFTAENRQGPELGLRTHIAGPVRSRFFTEVGASVSRTTFETVLKDDVEGASNAVAELSGYRFGVDAGMGWNLWRTDRASVFVGGTGGWMRDLVDSAAMAQDGAVGTIGAGVKYWGLRRNPRQLRYGFRIDGHLAVRWNGIALDSKQVQLGPVFTAGLIIGS